MPAPKDPKRYAEFVEKCRRNRLGTKHSAETKAKIGAATTRTKKGVPRPDMRGDRNPMRQPEIAKKVSEAKKGRAVSAKQRTQIAETLSGRTYPVGWGRMSKRKAGYGAAHIRLIRDRGRISEHSCEVCGKSAAHWALSHEALIIEINRRGQRYSFDPNDYVAMCARCHKSYDSGTLSI